LSVLDPASGAVLGSQDINAAEVQTHRFYAFSFDGDVGHQGQLLVLVLTAVSTTEGSGVAVAMMDWNIYRFGTLSFEDRDITGDLAYRCHYNVTPIALLGDRLSVGRPKSVLVSSYVVLSALGLAGASATAMALLALGRYPR
jgi:hypothetical protein